MKASFLALFCMLVLHFHPKIRNKGVSKIRNKMGDVCSPPFHSALLRPQTENKIKYTDEKEMRKFLHMTGS